MRLIAVHDLLQFDRTKLLSKVLPMSRYVLVSGVFSEPCSHVFRVRDRCAQRHKADVGAYGLHARDHRLQCSPAGFLENVDLVDEEKLHELHEPRVVFPLAGHAVPLLGCCYDYPAALNAPQLRVISVPCKFGTLEAQRVELPVPVPETLRAERLGGRLVDDFEALVFQFIEQSADCQLHYDRLAASSGCGKYDIIVSLIHRIETFRLNRIEYRERKKRSVIVWEFMRRHQNNASYRHGYTILERVSHLVVASSGR